MVAEDHVHGDAIAPGVIDRHRGVLQADGPVRHDGERLAFGLEIAVRHGDRRLFVQAGDELGTRVAAVVDHRLVQAAEARAGVRANELEIERLEDIDHVVRTRALTAGHDLHVGRRRGFRLRRHDGRRGASLNRGGIRRLRPRHVHGAGQRRGTGERAGLEECTPLGRRRFRARRRVLRVAGRIGRRLLRVGLSSHCLYLSCCGRIQGFRRAAAVAPGPHTAGARSWAARFFFEPVASRV